MTQAGRLLGSSLTDTHEPMWRSCPLFSPLFCVFVCEGVPLNRTSLQYAAVACGLSTLPASAYGWVALRGCC